MTRIGGGGPGVGTSPHGASPHGMIGVGIGMIGIGRRIGKGEVLIKGKRKRKSKTPGGQVPLMQPRCPKKGTTKADQLALGQWATKEGCTTNKGPMKRGLPGNRQKQSSKNKRRRKKKDWKKKRTKRKSKKMKRKKKRSREGRKRKAKGEGGGQERRENNHCPKGGAQSSQRGPGSADLLWGEHVHFRGHVLFRGQHAWTTETAGPTKKEGAKHTSWSLGLAGWKWSRRSRLPEIKLLPTRNLRRKPAAAAMKGTSQRLPLTTTMCWRSRGTSTPRASGAWTGSKCTRCLTVVKTVLGMAGSPWPGQTKGVAPMAK